ncbi:hypothetical protein MCP1_70120 [Candidatus Terasakiella magnetica]|nr:hypothetical protein MCP1_70120 [Candidatus Terasakiella magnetica]
MIPGFDGAMTSDRHRVDVWIADVTRRPGGADPAWLSQSERAIAARRCAAPDLWLNGRLLLRQILGKVLHADPAELSFRQGAAGKPELVGTPLHFNLSHCGPLMAVAASRGGPVGIDIEAERRSSGLEAGMRRWVLSDAELNEWTGFSPRRTPLCPLSPLEAQGGGVERNRLWLCPAAAGVSCRLR